MQLSKQAGAEKPWLAAAAAGLAKRSWRQPPRDAVSIGIHSLPQAFPSFNMPPALTAFFSRPSLVFGTAILLRLGLLVYGRWQDAHTPVKYTDIDYLVFTDAAKFVSRGRSPYDRATYRYTPLLAWLLYPTTWQDGSLPWFEFGKALFAAGDIITGWLIARILRNKQHMSTEASMKYASIWLLNPMVANISTRGSSEGLVVVFVIALLSAVLDRKISLAGLLLGFGVHFKIYPFIYAATLFWWLGPAPIKILRSAESWSKKLKMLLTAERIVHAREALLSFTVLNAVMYYLCVSRSATL